MAKLEKGTILVKLTQRIDEIMPFRTVVEDAGARYYSLSSTNVIGVRATPAQLCEIGRRVTEYAARVPIKGTPHNASAQRRAFRAVKSRIEMSLEEVEFE